MDVQNFSKFNHEKASEKGEQYVQQGMNRGEIREDPGINFITPKI